MKQLQSLYIVYREGSQPNDRTFIKVFQSSGKGYPFEESTAAFGGQGRY